MNQAALTGRTIAITRPLGQATKLNALITAAGGKPVAFPLIAIAPLDDYSAFEQVLAELPGYDWAMFISSNAVQNAMPRLLAALNGIPPSLQFAAIGPVTATELKAFGVEDVLTPQQRFDSEALLALPQMQDAVGKRVMIFRGVGGREVLADTLKARGALVQFAECYRRINPQTDTSLLEKLSQDKQLHAIVVTSSEAMRFLLESAGIPLNSAIKNSDIPAWLRQTLLCVNHARIAELALQYGLKVRVAQSGGEGAMLQCLIQALPSA